LVLGGKLSFPFFFVKRHRFPNFLDVVRLYTEITVFINGY
jgi:hypothetical protein